MVKVKDIFVAGGQPSVTYVNRSSANLESSLKRAIAKGYQLISLTGPTKVGKTVLCRRIIERNSGIWLTGGEIGSEQEFWNTLSYKLDIESERTSSFEKSKSHSDKVTGSVIALKGQKEDTQAYKKSETLKYQYTSKVQCLEKLARAGKTLIIDDFHYLSREVQLAVIRALKEKIFEGLTVIVLAVPHRAYDAVRLETEMTGRVSQVKVERWSEDELAEIAQTGFSELGLKPSTGLIRMFITESRSSPHLMQSFCADLCFENEVYTSEDVKRNLTIRNSDQFFRSVADNASKTAFQRLATGPRQRSDRLQRQFTDGTHGDIYLAILQAISRTGPASELSYEEIRASIKDVLKDEPPQAHEISRVLQKMSEVAAEKIEGEPVLEWNDVDKRLHIIDPYFAFT